MATETEFFECPMCRGEGVILVPEGTLFGDSYVDEDGNIELDEVLCPTCNGDCVVTKEQLQAYNDEGQTDG